MAEDSRRRHDIRARHRATTPGIFRQLFVSQFSLIDDHLDALDHPANDGELGLKRKKMRETLLAARGVHALRQLVTLALLVAVLSTLVTGSLSLLEAFPDAVVAIEVAATFAASSTVILVVARAVLDSYLMNAFTVLTFLAIEIAAGSAAKA